jgi:hypothetical protein
LIVAFLMRLLTVTIIGSSGEGIGALEEAVEAFFLTGAMASKLLSTAMLTSAARRSWTLPTAMSTSAAARRSSPTAKRSLGMLAILY